MKRILVYGMTDNRGGIESYVMALYRNADKEKVQFDFVTDFPTMAYDDEVKRGGSLIHYIPAKSKNPIGHLRAFRKILKNHPEYDTVYFNILNSGAAFTMSVAKSMGRRCIVHSHNNSDGNMRLHNFFKQRLIKYADKRLACSVPAAEFMFGTADGCFIINNAISIKDFLFSPDIRESKRSQLGIGDGTFAVLHVGRISPQKNPRAVIDIFGEVQKLRPDSVLLYVGTGEQESEIKSYTEQKGLCESVRFFGMRDDVNEIYSAADVFLLPSLYEGLGIVLIEAQTAGLPCFTSDSVPRATAVTELITYIPLSAPAAEWAKEICAFPAGGRRSMDREVAAAGYSIDDVVGRTVQILAE